MNNRSRDGFDRKGLSFIAKTLIVIALLIVSTKLIADGAAVFFLSIPKNTALAGDEETISPLETAEATNITPPPPQFITGKTIEESVPEEGKFIGANLDTMKLYLYEDGEHIKTYDILSKGRPGSRWETPSGSYEILYKTTNHFSSIGEVWMPYSMQFFGNFFIHGWPYYDNGIEVSEGYSGGCVRMSTPDAKEIYEFADVGTTIYVFESYDSGTTETGESEEGETELIAKIREARGLELADISLPNVSAASYVVADIDSGQIYAQKNADESRPIASLTKLMTALIANDTIHYDREIVVTERAASAYGNMAEFSAGERMSVTDLMYPMLLYSANDAAISIGDYFGEGYFSSLMNNQARALGMTKSRFVEPSGLSAENVSSAKDVFKLAQYIHQRKNFILDLTRTESKTIHTNFGSHTFKNIHQLRNIEGYLGGKNGFINASGKTLLTLLETTDKNGNLRTVAIVVLGSDDSASDTLSLLSWLKKAL